MNAEEIARRLRLIIECPTLETMEKALVELHNDIARSEPTIPLLWDAPLSGYYSAFRIWRGDDRERLFDEV